MTDRNSTPFETLVSVTSRLVVLMNQEVALLRAMRVSEIAALQPEKQELTVLYEEAVRTLSAEPELLEAMEPAMRSELAEMAVRFDEAVSANTRALDAVKTSHDQLLQAIVDAVSESRSRQKTYTAQGSLESPRKGRGTSTLSLTLDQRL
jgi:phage-related minor tail protein